MVSTASWKSSLEALAMEDKTSVQREVGTDFVTSVVGLVPMAWWMSR